MKIVTADDIFLSEIENSLKLKNLIDTFNKELEKETFYKREYRIVVNLETPLSDREISLLKYLYKEHGWDVVVSCTKPDYKYTNEYVYSFILLVLNPFYI